MNRLVLGIAGVALAFGSSAAEPMAVAAAWIRATPPGARTAAAYLTLTNPGAADRLVGATTPAARVVELHTHVMERGMQRMARIEDLPLPAGGTVRLAPGGLHLMLIDLATPLEAGTKVAVSLYFAGAEALHLDVPVIDARAASP